MVKRVAVIGAGAAGLASARWLVDAKLEPVVFERTNAVGGLWRPDTGLAYPSLRTNTSKQTTAFSDLPFDDALPDHPYRDDVLAYLERYADLVGVRPRIRFGRAVAAVRATGDGEGWTVDGEAFDGVVVASGLFARELETLRSLRAKLDGPLCDALKRLLAPSEMRALNGRVDRLIRMKVFPQPDPYRMAVPWPPF